MTQYPDTIYAAYQRLLQRRALEKDLSKWQDTQFHIPLLDIEAEKRLRQRPDYEDLIIDFYANPDSNDTDLKSGDIVYKITEVDVFEEGGTRYRMNRALGRTQFDGGIRLILEFAGPTPNSLTRTPDYPFFDEEKATFWREFDGDRWLLAHDWEGDGTVERMLTMLNQSMAAVWNSGQTIEEVTQRVVAWKQFNQAKEQWR